MTVRYWYTSAEASVSTEVSGAWALSQLLRPEWAPDGAEGWQGLRGDRIDSVICADIDDGRKGKGTL